MNEGLKKEKAKIEVKKGLSFEEKERLCEELKGSGLSLAEFCRLKGLASSTVHGWVKGCKPKKSSCWLPVVIEKKSQDLEDQVHFEVNLDQPRILRGWMKSSEFKAWLER